MKIDTSPVVYYSLKDEQHFFTWLQEIECIKSVERGVIDIETSNLTKIDLQELIAVLYRYKVPMS